MRRSVNLPLAAFAGLWAAGIWYVLLSVGRPRFELALTSAAATLVGTAAFAAGLASWLISRNKGSEADGDILVASVLTWPIFSTLIGPALMIVATIQYRGAIPSGSTVGALAALLAYWFVSFFFSSAIALPASLFGGVIFFGLRAALKVALRVYCSCSLRVP